MNRVEIIDAYAISWDFAISHDRTTYRLMNPANLNFINDQSLVLQIYKMQ